MAYEPYKNQTPPGSAGVVNYFESFNKENEQRNRAMLGMPQQPSAQKPIVDWDTKTRGYQPNVEVPQPHKDYIPIPSAPLPNGLNTPTAESAYQQSFPRPKDGIQQAANNATQTPQLTQPKQSEYLYQQVRTDNTPSQSTFNPDDYKDGTADGLGRNFLSSLSAPTPEDEEEKDNQTSMRILALGNALRHIGNIVYTSKGSPVQMFNDPVAMKEQRIQVEKARKQAADYQKAQAELQRQKIQGDQDYKNFLANIRLGDLDRKNKLDEYNAKRNADNDKFNHELAGQKQKAAEAQQEWQRKHGDAQLNETMRHNKASEGLGAQRLSVAWYNATHKGKGGSGGSGSGAAGGKHVLGSAHGYYTSPRNLNKAEWKQIYNQLDHLKVLTPAKKAQIAAAYRISESAGNAVVQEAAGWEAMRDGRASGDTFRKFLTNTIGLGYVPTSANNITVTNKAKKAVKPTGASTTAKATKPVKPAQKSGSKGSSRANFIINGK